MLNLACFSPLSMCDGDDPLPIVNPHHDCEMHAQLSYQLVEAPLLTFQLTVMSLWGPSMYFLWEEGGSKLTEEARLALGSVK